MQGGVFDTGKVIVEIKLLNPERILNILWNENINIINAKRIDVVTLRVAVEFKDYDTLKDIVRRLKGKSKIVGKRGFLFFVYRLRNKVFLTIGAGVFILILLYLSTYIWSIEIVTKNNVTPYEIRQDLYDIGIIPGTNKKEIDVKELERKIEDINTDILWIRIRIEGSTLKVAIEEKVNPPEIKEEEMGNLVSRMEGVVSRVYVFSGRSNVHPGDVVNQGDILIEGINGKEENPYEVAPDGVVIANTFYEKSMEVKVNGTELKRNGNKDSDIYLEILGKKIYLKKAIKGFKEYDKIEESGKILNKVNYFEKEEIEVKLSKEEAINKAVEELQESLYNNLTREAKVIDKIIKTKGGTNGNIIVNVAFVVEQNIVSNTPVDDNNPIEY
jgi:similar to stage IV sporulation protein